MGECWRTLSGLQDKNSVDYAGFLPYHGQTGSNTKVTLADNPGSGSVNDHKRVFRYGLPVTLEKLVFLNHTPGNANSFWLANNRFQVSPPLRENNCDCPFSPFL